MEPSLWSEGWRPKLVRPPKTYRLKTFLCPRDAGAPRSNRGWARGFSAGGGGADMPFGRRFGEAGKDFANLTPPAAGPPSFAVDGGCLFAGPDPSRTGAAGGVAEDRCRPMASADCCLLAMSFGGWLAAAGGGVGCWLATVLGRLKSFPLFRLALTLPRQ